MQFARRTNRRDSHRHSLRISHRVCTEPPGLVDAELPQLHQSAHAVPTLHVQNSADSAHRLARDCGNTQTGERPQRLHPRRYVREGVRVQGSRAAIVPGVERGQQLADLGTATLANDETVRSHPKRFAHQPGHAHFAGALQVRLTGFQRNKMLMVHLKLGDIFDRNNPVARCRTRQQRREQCGFSAAGRPGDQNVGACSNEGTHPRGRHEIEESVGLQLAKCEACQPRNPNGEQRAGGGDRGERLRTSVRRRWNAIEACETRPVDRLRGVVAAARAAAGKAMAET